MLTALAWFEIANRNKTPPLRISEYTQLTHNGHAGYVVGTDGIRLYLNGYNEFSVQQVAVSGGEIEPVPSITIPKPVLLDVSPDGSSLLAVSRAKGLLPSAPLYSVQVLGGSNRYLADARDAIWSPDGKFVACSTPSGAINIIDSDGSGGHTLASAAGVTTRLSWSPDGKWNTERSDMKSR